MEIKRRGKKKTHTHTPKLSHNKSSSKVSRQDKKDCSTVKLLILLGKSATVFLSFSQRVETNSPFGTGGGAGVIGSTGVEPTQASQSTRMPTQRQL